MKTFKITLALILSVLFLKADENLVPNNSFENRTVISINHLPNEENQFMYINRRQVAGKTTPDWFSNRDPEFLGYTLTGIPSIQPATGTEYCGVAPYEGIEVRLAHGLLPTTLKRKSFYRISFWFCPRGSSTQLKVHLRNDKISENDLIGFPNAPLTNSVSFIEGLSFNVDINTDPNIDGSFIPGTWYQYETPPILMRSDDIKSLAITGDDEGSAGVSSPQFVYLDEVGLFEINICNLPCMNSLSLGPVDLIAINNVVLEGDNPLTMLFRNAVAFEFLVSNNVSGGNNQPIFYMSSLDALGLNNIGEPFQDNYEPYYRFEWYGDRYEYDQNFNRVSDERVPLADGVYSYEYIIYGCPSKIESNQPNTLTFLASQNENFPYQGETTPEMFVFDYPHCCQTFRYISNSTENGHKHFKATESIFIGNDANIFNQGNTVFTSTSRIKLLAGNEITIENEFETLYGAELIGEITDCQYSQNSFFHRIFDEPNLEEIIDEKLNNETYIYPDPADGSFQIHIPSGESERVQQIHCYDLNGRLVENMQFDQNNANILVNRNNLSIGLYIIVLYTTEKEYKLKLSVQR